MARAHERYSIKGLGLAEIRNRNEARVIKYMIAILEEPTAPCLMDEEIMDVYALALNSLPARYAQTGTIVLRDPVRNEDIEDAVHEAIRQVTTNPKI